MAGFANRVSATRDIKHALRDILGCDAIRSGGDEYDIAGALQRRLGSLSIRGNPLQGGCRHSCEVDLHQGFVSGDLRIEGRSVESCSNFSSLRASSSVAHQGKWMFEVTLGTSGIMQLGWATSSCQFSNEEGVGDSMDSYSFDGKRVRKWNISCIPYGQEWAQGDVIGCGIDLDGATVSFWRNGVDLGTAFQNIRRLAYFPAASLSYGERCEFNFGSRPFAYPTEDYHPLIKPPAYCAGAAYLLGCFRALTAAQLAYKRSCTRGTWAVLSEAGILKQLLLDLGGLLGPMLEDEYVVMGAFLPFLQSLVEEPAMAGGGALFLATSLMKNHIASSEMRAGLLHAMECLSWRCRTGGTVAPGAGKGGLQTCLELVAALLHTPYVRDVWLAAPSWKTAFEGFLAVKAPSPRDLAACLPFVHWPDAEKLGMDSVSKEAYKRASRDLQAAMAAVYERHSELCGLLLATPGADTWGRQDVPNRLTELVQHLVRKNRGANRNVPPPGLSDNSVLVSAFFMLLRTLRPYLEGRAGHDGGLSTFPAGLMFLQGVGTRHLDPYSGAGRLGGTLSHLEKTAKPDAAALSTMLSVPVVQQPEAAGTASPPAGPATPGQPSPRLRCLERTTIQASSASSGSCSSSSTVSSRDSSEGSECTPMDTCPPANQQHSTRKRLHVSSSALGERPGAQGANHGRAPSPSGFSWSGAGPLAALPQREPLQSARSAPGALPSGFPAFPEQPPPPPPRTRGPAAEPLGSPFEERHRRGDLPPRSLFQGPPLPSWGAHPSSHGDSRAAAVPSAHAASGSSTSAAPDATILGERAHHAPRDRVVRLPYHSTPAHRCPYFTTRVLPTRCDSVPAPCSFAAGPALARGPPEAFPTSGCPPSALPPPPVPMHFNWAPGISGTPQHQAEGGPPGSCSSHQQAAGEVRGGGQSRRAPALTGREAACLLDALLRLYHLGMVGAFRCASFQQQTATQAQQHVEELKHQLQSMENNDEELLKWAKSMKSWQRMLVDSARFAAWHNACLFGARDVEGLLVLGSYTARLLSALSEHRVLFAYVPELYLEALLDGFHAVRSRPHVARSPLFAACADALVPFLARRFRDSAIVGPDLREMMLQTVSLLLQTKSFVVKFEESHDARAHLVRGLLEAFNGRDWVPVSSILARLTSSNAFGASLARAASSSSVIFQASLVHICEGQIDLCETFLNRLFAMLNWTLTEFTVSAQELGEGTAVAQGTAVAAGTEDALKRRCVVMLELSATLARVLEFVTARLPRAFVAGPPLNMARLAETACFVVAHMAAPTAAATAIAAVLASRFPAAQNAKRAVLLAPVLGMLLNVWQSERDARGRRSAALHAAEDDEGQSLVEALHAVGFSCYASCIGARSVLGLAAEEFPTDALWMDRCAQLDALASALQSYARQRQRTRQNGGDSSDEDVPDEFIDPIMMTTMTDPVLLPDSRTAIDRSTAVRHLLSSATDPFTRAPLSLEELQDDVALRMRIDSWRAKRRRS